MKTLLQCSSSADVGWDPHEDCLKMTSYGVSIKLQFSKKIGEDCADDATATDVDTTTSLKSQPPLHKRPHPKVDSLHHHLKPPYTSELLTIMSTYDKLASTGTDAAKTAAYGSERAQQEAHNATQNTTTTAGAYTNEATSAAGSLLNTAQQYAASAGVRCSCSSLTNHSHFL